MVTSHKNPIRYIVDENGTKTDVIMPINVFNKLSQPLEDAYFAKLAEHVLNTETEWVDWDQTKKRLLKKKTK